MKNTNKQLSIFTLILFFLININPLFSQSSNEKKKEIELLKAYAEGFEFGRVTKNQNYNVPIPPTPPIEIAEIITASYNSGDSVARKYVYLILLKAYKAQLICCNSSYLYDPYMENPIILIALKDFKEQVTCVTAGAEEELLLKNSKGRNESFTAEKDTIITANNLTDTNLNESDTISCTVDSGCAYYWVKKNKKYLSYTPIKVEMELIDRLRK